MIHATPITCTLDISPNFCNLFLPWVNLNRTYDFLGPVNPFPGRIFGFHCIISFFFLHVAMRIALKDYEVAPRFFSQTAMGDFAVKPPLIPMTFLQRIRGRTRTPGSPLFPKNGSNSLSGLVSDWIVHHHNACERP